MRLSTRTKIKNATPTEVDGIKFRSKLEAYTHQALKQNNIEAEYEKHIYELLPKFEFHDEKIRPITYKPDFVGESFIIECKGFPNDAFPLKEKLFKWYMKKNMPGMIYFIVRTQKNADETIKQIKNTHEKSKNK
jgi:hypothetical protein